MALTPRQVEEVEELLALGKGHCAIERLTGRARGTIETIAAGGHRVQRKRAIKPSPIVFCKKHEANAVDGRCVACEAEKWQKNRRRRLPIRADAAELALDPEKYGLEALAEAREHSLTVAAEGDGPTETRYGRLAEELPLPASPPAGPRSYLAEGRSEGPVNQT